MFKKPLFIILASVLLIGTIATSATWAFSKQTGWKLVWNQDGKLISIDDTNSSESLASLPTVGSRENLLALLKDNIGNQPMYSRDGMAENEMAPTSDAVQSSKSTVAGDSGSSKKSSGNSDYSKTNVQTEGVDEADIIKTDGTYIYKLSSYYFPKLTVIKAFPADQMEIVSTIDYQNNLAENNNNQYFYPLEMYVDDSQLIVIGTYNYMRVLTKEEQTLVDKGYYVNNYISTTKVIVYDISDKSNVKAVRDIELEGYYVTSRKIGDSLYFVNNKYMDYWYFTESNKEVQNALEITPRYRDSIEQAANEYATVALEDVRYFPTSITPNYLLIGGVNLGNNEQPVQVTSYLGSGQNVYVSQDNLYVAVTETNYFSGGIRPMSKEIDPAPETLESSEDATTSSDAAVESKIAVRPGIAVEPAQNDTTVYKFKLDNGKVEFVANGKVPGTILNQFSMDEHEGNFRIATTTGNAWGADDTSKNNVYVLDREMKISGKLENLAPGERIYSVRFMGDRAYVVTFKTVDPLFVIDLSNSTAPKVLGELKIPGYSSYLHPIDENHILGFGVDTQEIENEWDPKGDKIAIAQGLKLALFDVSDVNNPVEKFKEAIGGRGSYSELLYNHKALLYSQELELLAFPAVVYEPAVDQENRWNYGPMSFQGLYVYKFNQEEGFQLRGRISHISQTELDNMSKGWGWDGGNFIQRGLYIGDVLYTVSENLLQANNLNSLKEIGQVVINKSQAQVPTDDIKIEEQKKLEEQQKIEEQKKLEEADQVKQN